MATTTLSVDMSILDASLARCFEQIEPWSDRKKDRFTRGWLKLQAAGAECVDLERDNGTATLRGTVSDDFRRYARQWGVVL